MADLIEKIGPIVGVVAFLGLAILAFLIFQQAREVRRLREWAGRAPERANEAADATAAAAEARGEALPEPEIDEPEPEDRAPGRLGEWWAGVRERFAPAWAELDRRSPVDPRYFVVVIAAAIVALAVLTSGFGLFGGDDAPGGNDGGKAAKEEKEEKVEVAVLNGTQELDVNGELISGVPGLANDVAKQVVKPAGFAIGEKTNAAEGLGSTTIFYAAGSGDAASELANAVAPELGQPQVEPMIDDVESLAAGAPLVVVIGRDDADAFGG
jgi:hypothetical protein